MKRFSDQVTISLPLPRSYTYDFDSLPLVWHEVDREDARFNQQKGVNYRADNDASIIRCNFRTRSERSVHRRLYSLLECAGNRLRAVGIHSRE